MSLKKLKVLNLSLFLKRVVLFLSCAHFVKSQTGVSEFHTPGSNNNINNPLGLELATKLVYASLSNTTTALSRDIATRASFCIKDAEVDWNKAFNFSSNLDFVSACLLKTNGDMGRRMCTAAETKFYLNGFFGQPNTKPNGNCNLSTWVPGCEPGWSCSAAQNQQVDLRNSQDIPTRTIDCQPCCEGFFCPQGLTCMIPCPLGSYCPTAKLNEKSSICEPYTYRLPPGRPNHTCGGANVWSDVRSSREVFCSAGSYCPTTTKEETCRSGHYCRVGSTTENPCFKLTSCDPNTEYQNVHVYGAMVLVALAAVLLIIHSCSDRILIIRERRLAKSRESAARAARTRQRWKVAKDAVHKHARELQTQISRTFSRTFSSINSDRDRMLDRAEYGESDDLIAPAYLDTSGASPSAPQEEKMEPSGSQASFGIEIVDPKKKKQSAKAKKLTTKTQIFNYAYGQLEKEKAIEQENKTITFSGLISMASDTVIRKRPVIELSFQNLTLTLKGKKKCLLKSVTGSIKPGRITAVMGPSGAGKTTLLTALAGKPVGCTITGVILINGKKESIHSYKKIIGFVPQDDIVHGNLTVEENLWFHAKCRLSAKLVKADKVLVVERVIESLGLQSVRSSLVGTVEERGISGGQRKRVNVGLEMVMEPSVLFLDEPTSGLDSASSQLLLRALRHEALEGVNVSLVVHQPSYTLFKKFDDLILLAKGGVTVYHGAVDKVEEYFSTLGIYTPDRINPPDYYIDILEGIVVPGGDCGVSAKDLPLRWMLHNGYPIPTDMQQNAAPHTNQTTETNVADAEQSFAGELWQDVKTNAQVRQDKIRHNFLKSNDLSNRKTPGLFSQYRYYLGRIGKQRLREAKLQVVDYMILLLAGACLGSLSRSGDETFGAAGYTYTIIAVCLLCKIAALRSFSLDKLHQWRESASGMSTLACFLAKDTIDHFNTVIKPVVYLSMFYFFTNPRSTFQDNYIVLLCLVYCVTGIAYVLAIFFHPGSAQLFSVLLPVVLTLVATRSTNSDVMKSIADLCYPKWALEAFVLANAQRYYGVWLFTRCGALMRSGYDIHEFYLCLVILLLIGVITRFIAYIGLLALQKK